MGTWAVKTRGDVRNINPQFHDRLWTVWTRFDTKDEAEKCAAELRSTNPDTKVEEVRP